MTEMTSRTGNSAASRDKAYYLHPYTNLKTHEDVGPLVIERGEGVHVFDDSGKAYIEGMAGLWCTSLGFGEERLVGRHAADAEAVLPRLHAQGARSRHRSGRGADQDSAGADVQGVLHQLRFRSQRHGRQAGLVLQQRSAARTRRRSSPGRRAITASPSHRQA